MLTEIAQNYIVIFSSYMNQFLKWGKWLFFSLLLIQIVWLTLWYAFDYHSFTESMIAFVKRIFIITLFYTIMINPSWLADVVKTALFMGNSLTGMVLDPSSLIMMGITIGNKIIIPIQQSNLMNMGFGVIFISTVYLVVVFSFISIAIDMAVLLIAATALISFATLFIGFVALGATAHIARQSCDIILENCIKLLGIYLVIGPASTTLQAILVHIPTTIKSFDPYVWIMATTLLFLSLTKYLPRQLSKVVRNAITDMRFDEIKAITHVVTGSSQTEHRISDVTYKNEIIEQRSVRGLSDEVPKFSSSHPNIEIVRSDKKIAMPSNPFRDK